jgi:ribosomal protein L37E
MDKNEKQPTLIQCSRCEGSSSHIIDHHIYVCPKCGFTRDLSTQTQEKKKVAHMPYTEEEWEMISNAHHVPPQEDKDKDSHEKKESKDEKLKDAPFSDWDDYPYIPISQWLYKRH